MQTELENQLLMNIITKQLIHDAGKVEWTPSVHYGYLDQHTVLTPGKTMRDVLKDAFLPLYEQENELNASNRQNGRCNTRRIRRTT